jgi:hypothetical protein
VVADNVLSGVLPLLQNDKYIFVPSKEIVRFRPARNINHIEPELSFAFLPKRFKSCAYVALMALDRRRYGRKTTKLVLPVNAVVDALRPLGVTHVEIPPGACP